MLKSLAISNLAVIAESKIEFESGLNILTGETGAGKSIIIDAINLVLGSRASKDMIRSGENKAKIEALFYVDKNISELLSSNGIECEDELLVVREISLDGKSVIRINGSLATLNMLRELSAYLVNIHGQHDNQALLNPEKHIYILDDYADTYKEKEEYNQCFLKLKEVREKIKSISTDSAERERRIGLLMYETEAIRNAEIKKGEYEELMEKRKIMANMLKITEGSDKAYNLIAGSYNGTSALELLSKALKETQELSVYSEKISEINQNISQAYFTLEDLSKELRNIVSDTEFNEGAIDETEKRIDELNDIKRRFGQTYEEINEYYLKAKDELELLKNTDENTRLLEEELSRLKADLKTKGEALSLKRKKGAKALEKRIISELSDLNMPNAQFEVKFEMTDKFYKDGIDKVEFMLSVNPGILPGKLSKIASGGELSRIMLGLSSALIGKYNVSTMIYDEIDTGVSGRAAQKIAEKMWRVSKDRQVLSVTHLPQIAAMADNHFFIEKETVNNTTKTKVTLLDEKGRINEIARITGGVSVNETTLKSAGDMLKQSEVLKRGNI